MSTGKRGNPGQGKHSEKYYRHTSKTYQEYLQDSEERKQIKGNSFEKNAADPSAHVKHSGKMGDTYKYSDRIHDHVVNHVRKYDPKILILCEVCGRPVGKISQRAQGYFAGSKVKKVYCKMHIPPKKLIRKKNRSLL